MLDVDGTLIRSIGAVDNCFLRVLSLQDATIDVIHPHGQTDPLILVKTATHFGVPSNVAAEKLPDMKLKMIEYAREHVEEVGEGLEVLPGIASLLDALSKRNVAIRLGHFRERLHRRLGLVFGGRIPAEKGGGNGGHGRSGCVLGRGEPSLLHPPRHLYPDPGVSDQGCIICLLLAIGWSFAAYIRNRVIRKMKLQIAKGNYFAFICEDINDLESSAQENLPRVTVIMPLKGFGEHNLQNWRTQITSLYGGPLEFLFVVDSTDDPAYHAVSLLISEFQDNVDAKIIVAGLSTTCSQKIHNQLFGVEKMHKDSKYVLFLDDDVRLHPGSIGTLTAEMEKNPKIFIQTGYPLDLPSGSLGSYCIYEYHMPCSMGFATGGQTFFLWGGCMMMHAEDFRRDLYGVVSGLRDGGYSDDMTLAAIAGQHKRLIWSPPAAVFPHPLASDLSFSRYWNYLRKQTFVLESYTTKVNQLMNRALFHTHCYLSWGFVCPYLMALIHVAAFLRAPSDAASKESSASSCGLLLSSCLLISTVIELLAMLNLTKVEIQLCNMLSPEGPTVSQDSYKWGLVFLAMLVDNFLYPICAVRSHFSQSINWSGVQYYLKDGKINKIERSLENGPRYSDLAWKTLFYGKRQPRPKTSILSFLSRKYYSVEATKEV
ncbi:hypothetical protein Cni_G24898 [Canna indica]|uniref:ceramide glucosyltransferase n=1 Tax=Canna indica TaxID=4628 RepID=A0AAQ3QKJ6_9LILI|nr:hypothetical protein Cni_G24898 [Canna indica]